MSSVNKLSPMQEGYLSVLASLMLKIKIIFLYFYTDVHNVMAFPSFYVITIFLIKCLVVYWIL